MSERLHHARPSVEEELALLLCQTSAIRAHERDAIVRLGRAADPDRLISTLIQQGILALAGSRLLDFLGADAPEPVRDAVDGAARAIGRRSVLFESATTSLLAELENAGIRAVPLKGVLLAKRVHGDAILRPSGDIDVLVSRDDFQRAARIVESQGYAPPDDPPFVGDLPNLHYTLMALNGWPPPVELHWRIHWYESSFSEQMVRRSVVDERGLRLPQPADELASLLLFYQRDSFTGLRLAADISAWWDTYGEWLGDGALRPIADDHPELRDALVASAAVVERLVGVPATRLVASGALQRRRAAAAARLGDWRYVQLDAQGIANMGLIDWLLTPCGGRRAFVRRYLFQPPLVFAREHGLPERPRVRDHVRRVLHAVARSAKSAGRFSRGLWEVRGGHFRSPLPASMGHRPLLLEGPSSRKKAALPSVLRECEDTSIERSDSRSNPISPSPDSLPQATESGRA